MIKSIKPARLRPGDRIGVISPSEPVTSKKRLYQGVKVLEEMGFKVVLGDNVLGQYGIYMAGTDKERASDINAMFRNPKIKGIFCTVGGLSSNRLLGLIDYKMIKKNPKVLMGFSDITVLLNAIHKKTGLITFHGEHVEYGFSRGLERRYRYTRAYFEKALMSAKPIGDIEPFEEPIRILKPGKTDGLLLGGNMEILAGLIGTEYEPDWEEKILFWEEFTETPEDIDFFLTRLRLAGVFDKISGMVIGKLTNCDFPYRYKKSAKKEGLGIDKIILEICQDFQFPIVTGVPFGHVHPQVTIPIGVRAVIDANNKKKPLFSIVERAVK